jgi:formiminotetrahydrofolate cyclodeaminase
MPSYSTLSLQDLLDAFASRSAVPGGGAAVALTGATGVTLLIMVAGIRRESGGASGEAELSSAAARLGPLRDTLTALIDRDAAAYAALIRARGLSRGPAGSTGRHGTDLDPAIEAATETQLDVMRGCRDAVREALVVATHGAPGARADVAVAIELLCAASRGAATNVDSNVAMLKAGAAAVRAVAERRRLEGQIEADAAEGMTRLALTRGNRQS